MPQESLVYPRIHYGFPWEERLPDAPGGLILVVAQGESAPYSALHRQISNCRLQIVRQSEQALEQFLSSAVDVVLLEHSLDHASLDLLSRFKVGKPSVPVIVIAEQSSESQAIEAFRRGARDYFSKPLELDELAWTLRALLSIRQTGLGRTAQAGASSLEKALNFIQRNYRSSLSLQRVADKSGMSLSTFVRRFKKKTGMTFVDYVNSLRISSARSLLRNSDLSLLQISLACGYDNQCHFKRTFKKIVGLTPGQYRRSLKDIH